MMNVVVATIDKPSHEDVAAGNAAANELWDLIYSEPQTNHRFIHAQKNRTLYHPSLPQPSPEEERLNLETEKKITHDTIKCYKIESLEARLSAALGKSQSLQTSSEIVEDICSPTSTLMFPDPVLPRDGSSLAANEISTDSFTSPVSTLMFHDVTMKMYMPTCETELLTEGKIHHIYDTPDHVISAPTENKWSELKRHSQCHSFVVCADTQLGMTNENRDWEIEVEYARKAVDLINGLDQKPSFCICCGDLVDMESSFHLGPESSFTREECNEIQDQQNRDFQKVWSALDDSIPLVCLCGNHDIGNRPTKASIERFRSAFGDEYLSFWVNGCFNIVLNNVLFSDPTGAPELFNEQLSWLENRLKYGNAHGADQIFVFAHHPWFLYNENEDIEDCKGIIPFPKEWGSASECDGFPEGYFSIQRKYRNIALNLFKKYSVSASFSGHFHQNLVSKSSWGMDMIITAPLSIVFESNGKPKQYEENSRGVRIVNVTGKTFTHYFKSI